jgi:hypothetical protein
MVAVRIGDLAEAVPPEHVVDRRNYLTPSGDGLIINRVRMVVALSWIQEYMFVTFLA